MARRLTIVQAAKLLAKAGHTFSPRPGPRLENGNKFVTYVTVDGKEVKAADVERLFLKGLSMSLARARQLSLKVRGGSVKLAAGGDEALMSAAYNDLTSAAIKVDKVDNGKGIPKVDGLIKNAQSALAQYKKGSALSLADDGDKRSLGYDISSALRVLESIEDSAKSLGLKDVSSKAAQALAAMKQAQKAFLSS